MWGGMMDFLQRGLFSADMADWITVCAYMIAAGLSWRAANAAYLRRAAHERMFWIGSAAALVFLGINELFDFQSLLTILAKIHAQSAGWYDDRRPLQHAFIVGLGVLGFPMTLTMLWLVRKLAASIRLALVGFIFIGVFVLFRAASFHHFDAVLGSGYQAFNFGSIQEMAGILTVALASLGYARRTSRAS